ncbi:response regulator transcription factor [Actinocorallia longicatena]|uniref:Response regulator transcription factor n=1 Tax=Actinocorallia longicatena TaxID=111803 RepID=A0ABP6QQI8_9ACTN
MRNGSRDPGSNASGSRVLVAEDDPKQARLIRLYLEQDGHSVLLVGDGRTALAEARAHTPDLVLLDVMMPGLDGLQVCRTLRAESAVPILVLTARSTEDDQLRGLDFGADDYLTKPYSPRVLTARVRALLRRSAGRGPSLVRKVGTLEIDPHSYEVKVSGRPVELTTKEFGVLQALAAEPGRVLSRAQILERAFGFDHYILDRTVDAHIMNLRRKLEDDPASPAIVQTVYGRGYRLGGG